ncbi:MAG: hypothetical protein CVU57_16720 [Deltaproteobacteria bacterium HGW-Deltaproteobacteria-15]|nr:MAG: hypothetical protein CVU57_16720 [Deltaproteobacteria bacterium HGW-Deltaproteobacteria-15]
MGALFKNEGVLGKVLPLQRKIIWERLDSPVSPPNGIFDALECLWERGDLMTGVFSVDGDITAAADPGKLAEGRVERG